MDGGSASGRKPQIGHDPQPRQSEPDDTPHGLRRRRSVDPHEATVAPGAISTEDSLSQRPAKTGMKSGFLGNSSSLSANRGYVVRNLPSWRVTADAEVTELLPAWRQSAKRAVQCCIGTGTPSLLRRQGSFLERGSGGANSFGVGRAGETEGSLELGRIEEIGRVVLVEHFIDFAD
jgi:hypothetical protein